MNCGYDLTSIRELQRSALSWDRRPAGLAASMREAIVEIDCDGHAD